MNVKEELVSKIQDKPPIKCALVIFEELSASDELDPPKKYILKVGYSQHDYEEFLNSLDFEYDNTYGRQELYGNVWFKDGTWLDRYVYDGAEWWQYRETPKIPDECL